VYFADQTENFPVNKTIQAMKIKSQYTKWLGALLIIKSDEERHPIACNGNNTFYIPEVMEQLVMPCDVSQLLRSHRFLISVDTNSPYKNGPTKNPQVVVIDSCI
jgi:tRNA U34 2-thiouridine synthase MnmA/TrmU